MFAPFRDEPGRAALFTDFDGTLSGIVADPEQARPVAGAVNGLDRLAHRLGAVWVVSGRPVSFLERFLSPPVRLSGLYGLESSVDGQRSERPGVERWRATLDAVADQAEVDAATRPALAGMRVERKGLGLTLHYHGRDDLGDAVRAYADEQGASSGLVVHAARRSYELRPMVSADKGDVVEAAAHDCRAACFIGDDRGDLPAFAALDRLASAAVHTVRIAVRSEEAPAELLDRADLVVDGPDAVVALLASL